MGSFNTSCFASHQTVAPNDRCMVMLIQQQASFSPVKMSIGAETVERYGICHSGCYADAFWKPVTCFISATYDDYGQVVPDFSEGAARESFILWLATLRRMDIKVHPGENTCHDIDFDLEAFLQKQAPLLRQVIEELRSPHDSRHAAPDEALLQAELLECWSYLHDRMREQRLFQLSSSREPRPVQLAILHESAYKALAQMIDSETNWQGETLERRAWFVRTVSAAREEALESVQRVESDDTSRLLEKKDYFLAMAGFHFESLIRDAFRRIAESDNSPIFRMVGHNKKALQSFLSGDLSAEGYFDVLAPLIEQAYVMGGLNMLNLRITPQIYAGQDYDNSIGQSYRKFLNVVEEQVSAGRCQNSDMFRFCLRDASTERVLALQAALKPSGMGMTPAHMRLEGATPLLEFWCEMYPENLVEALRKECEPATVQDVLERLTFETPD